MSRNRKNKTGHFSSQPNPQQLNQLREIYIQAQQLQQQGHLSEAEKLYREIIKVMPDQPDALHYLGLICMSKGDDEQAQKYIRQSINSSGNPFYLSNYGLLLSRQGKHKQAVEQYKKAVTLKPDYAEAWYNLGYTYSEMGDLDSAEDAYKNAIKYKHDYIKAMYSLYSVQEALSKNEDANETGNQLLSIKPITAVDYYTLGLALQYMGGYRNIHKSYEYLERAYELAPGSLEIHYALAKLLEEGNKIDEAIDIYNKILSAEPEYQDVKINYVQCLLKNDQVNEAEEQIKNILRQNPENVASQVILGNIHKIRGDFREAEAIYQRVLEFDNYNHGALAGLAASKKFTDKNDEFIDQLIDAASRKKSSATYYALGKIYNDLGEYDLAFDAYKKANDLKNRKVDFNPEQHAKYVDSIFSTFCNSQITVKQQYGNKSEEPVFIVGTPRSGTTLTEQIISSHPLAAGAGELKFIPHLVRGKYQDLVSETDYPERILSLTQEDIQKESVVYLNNLERYRDYESIIRITDKMPNNYFYVGYIFILFPNARIIHCQRNPLDACLSMYFQSFQIGHQYSFNLANLGHWYKDYIRLMDFWNSLYGERILNIKYDDTVNDTETTARKLIEFCGLDWDDKCIEFHKSKREILTASAWQVRQPIYKTSLERWKRYDKHIGVLKEILAGYY